MSKLLSLLKGTQIPGPGNRFWNWASKISEAVDAGGGGGGGGCTIIPDGGEISGTYKCNVLCEGTVTVTGDLEVQGSLTVAGDFINDSGHAVTIFDDLFAQNIFFDKTDTDSSQSDFLVGGDMVFSNMNFAQCGGTAATLRVGGNLIAGYERSEILDPFSGNVVCNGVADTMTNGLDITVFGDLCARTVSFSGSDGTAVPAGNGGYLEVRGSLNVRKTLFALGGSGTGVAAGYGGEADLYGDVSCAAVNFSGGNSDYRGGDGGYLYLYGGTGTFDLNEFGGIVLRGGESNSSSLAAYGGEGGIFEAYSSCCAPSIDVSGGAATDQGNGGSAGYVYVKGTLEVFGVYYNGKGVDALGGDSRSAYGGRGGSFECESYTKVLRADLSGGDSDPGYPAGSAGFALFASGVTCESIVMRDGPNGKKPAYSTELMVKGYCSFNSINMSDRVDAYILWRDNTMFPVIPFEPPAILRVLNLLEKATLNRPDSSQTASISPTTCESSLFISGTTGWYVVTGTLMV